MRRRKSVDIEEKEQGPKGPFLWRACRFLEPLIPLVVGNDDVYVSIAGVTGRIRCRYPHRVNTTIAAAGPLSTKLQGNHHRSPDDHRLCPVRTHIAISQTILGSLLKTNADNRTAPPLLSLALAWMTTVPSYDSEPENVLVRRRS